jgi:hypothetical protein
MKQLLAHPGFRLLLIGQGVSAFGDWVDCWADTPLPSFSGRTR